MVQPVGITNVQNVQMLPPDAMRSLIAKVAQRVVQGKTYQKRSELSKPDSLTAEDVEKFYLASEQVNQNKQPGAGLTADEFQQYLNAATQFQPTAKYEFYPQAPQQVIPNKGSSSGVKVKRGNPAQRSGYGGFSAPSAEYHTYDQGYEHHHEHHYPSKVVHYDEV